jgi:hypothetical protein
MHLPPSLWFAVMADLQQPERVQASESPLEVDGRVCTISYIARLRCVKVARETRGIEFS